MRRSGHVISAGRDSRITYAFTQAYRLISTLAYWLLNNTGRQAHKPVHVTAKQQTCKQLTKTDFSREKCGDDKILHLIKKTTAK